MSLLEVVQIIEAGKLRRGRKAIDEDQRGPGRSEVGHDGVAELVVLVAPVRRQSFPIRREMRDIAKKSDTAEAQKTSVSFTSGNAAGRWLERTSMEFSSA